MARFDFTYSPLWNLALITVGSAVCAVGLKAVAQPMGLVPGGLYGLSLLIHYGAPSINASLLYAIINVPLFIAGWLMVSRRFFFYSLYAVAILSVFTELVPFTYAASDPVLSAVACGVLLGAGGGIVLRSLGSGGGLDIVAVYLNKRFNIGVGRFYMAFNCLLFTGSFFRLEPDPFLASLLAVILAAMVTDSTLSLFSQRKMVLVVSDKNREIAKQVMEALRIGSTYLTGCGAYTGAPKEVLMTVINNIQLKRLEEIVFTIDPNALFIVENTFHVIGSGFSRRKLY